jgi:hypothetical protein
MNEKIKRIQERNKGVGGECEEMQLSSKGMKEQMKGCK